MRFILIMVTCLYSLLVSSQSQGADIDSVLNDMKKQELAWNAGDIPGFMEFYWKSDSLKFIGSSGITYGWDKTIGNYLKSYPSREAMGQLRFTIIEARQLSSSSIFIIGKWELRKEKPASGHFSLLWRKKNNRWVIVTDHTS